MIESEPELVDYINIDKDKAILFCPCPLPIWITETTGYAHLVSHKDAYNGVKCSKCGQIMYLMAKGE